MPIMHSSLVPYLDAVSLWPSCDRWKGQRHHTVLGHTRTHHFVVCQAKYCVSFSTFLFPFELYEIFWA